jgi:hypothetical protein
MLDDGLTAAQSRGEARDEVEVLDVAQMLLASVKGVSATKAAVVVGAPPGPAAPPAAGESVVETASVVEPGSVVEPASAASGVETPAAEKTSSLFGDETSLFGDQQTRTQTGPQPTEAKSEVEGTKDAEGKTGGSLFGDGASLFDTPVEEETKFKDEPEAAKQEKPTDTKADTRGAITVGETIPEGTSLFDVGEPEPEPEPEPELEPEPEKPRSPAEAPGWQVGDEIPAGQSLFDVGESGPEHPPAPTASAPVATQADAAPAWQVGDDIPEGQSLFDVGDRPGPVAISELATRAAPDAEDEETADEPEEDPKPTASATNTPRTDADINQTGSLFDL